MTQLHSSIKKYFILLFWMGIIFIQIPGCTKKAKTPEVPIVATVGSKVITLDDVRFRANLTIRHPRIKTLNAVLNNLIAEKIFVLEEGKDSPYTKGKGFQAYIKGIREQAMREELYKELAVKSVKIDTAELRTAFRLSQRSYDVDFFTINNPEINAQVEKRLEKDPGARSAIFDEIKELGQSGVQTVKWDQDNNDNVFLAMYSRPFDVGDVIGPVRIGPTQTIMIRIKNVQIEPTLGPEGQQLREIEVKKKLTDIKAKMWWEVYKINMMRGKAILFEKDVFNKIVDWYINANLDQDENKIGDPSNRPKDAPVQLQAPEQLNAMLDQPFFKIDGQTWTVGDFKQAMLSHPLVYDRQAIRPNEFAGQFKRAIAGLVVDQYLNKAAYKRGLDKNSEVQHTGELWSDALIAHHHFENYLKKINIKKLQEQDPSYLGMRAVDEYLNDLNLKYKGKVHINKDVLSQIKLVNIPIVAMRYGMPYPVVEPTFPQYSTGDTLVFSQ